MIDRPFRVCLVASEIIGAYKNGGIGTATSHLAALLGRWGHHVKLVYTGHHPIDHCHPWIARLRSVGVSIVHLSGARSHIAPAWMQESTAVFDYLQHSNHDLVMFQDWEGGAFSSVMARHAGIALTGTRIALIAHGPTAWLLDANRTLARDERTLAQLYMEEMSFRHADAVVCPSRHMLDWLGKRDFPLPEDSETLPLYLWSNPEGGASGVAPPLEEVRTIAYFGRLEKRKGIELFVEAIAQSGLEVEDARVVFVGKPATYQIDDVVNALALRCLSLSTQVSFRPDLDSDQAQDFLIAEKCLAVIPSLIDNAPCVVSECLRRSIPFLATATGGTPELVHEDDRDRVLVRPDAKVLARRIREALGRPFAPAKPAYEELTVARRWSEWLERQVGREPARRPERARSRVPAAPAPSVAVVVTHFERPALLRQTLDSLADQTTPDFDLVLVDDGSESLPARRALDDMEARTWPFRLAVLRRPNAYLGAARNAGVRATSAARVVFMDDDNLAFPTLIETLTGAMTETDADVVTCQMAIFTSPGGAPDLDLLEKGERWTFTGGPAALGLSVNCFGDATGMYRREVFERVGYFHERRGVGYEDWHLHARIALAGLRTVSLPVPLFWYRRLITGMHATTDQYENNKLIWDAYEAVMPPELRRLVGLAVRNDFVKLL